MDFVQRNLSITTQIIEFQVKTKMSKQYIFQMIEMTKKHGQKVVLNNIWLSFYPGAKIGVLGRNGSGKSTLLKIMAGIDKEIRWRSPSDRWIHRWLSCRRSRNSTPTKMFGTMSRKPSLPVERCSIVTTN